MSIALMLYIAAWRHGRHFKSALSVDQIARRKASPKSANQNGPATQIRIYIWFLMKAFTFFQEMVRFPKISLDKWRLVGYNWLETESQS